MSESEKKKTSDGAKKSSKKQSIPSAEQEAAKQSIPPVEQEIPKQSLPNTSETNLETKSENAVTAKTAPNTKSGLENAPASNEKDKLINNIEDSIPFSELCKQKLIQEFMKEAEKRSKLLKSKLVSQLNEVFKLFDINNDGIIDETDLKFTFASLGDKNVSEEKIKSMLGESSKPIDFEAFVGLFESKEIELFDNEIDLLKAFSKWDLKTNGFMVEERFRNDLITWGDRFSEKDADRALEEAPIYEQDGKPMIDYIEFCANLCGLQNIRNSEIFQEKLSNS